MYPVIDFSTAKGIGNAIEGALIVGPGSVIGWLLIRKLMAWGYGTTPKTGDGTYAVPTGVKSVEVSGFNGAQAQAEFKYQLLLDKEVPRIVSKEEG